MEKKIFYCEACGQTIFKKRKPIKCFNCGNRIIRRILTEDDLGVK